MGYEVPASTDDAVNHVDSNGALLAAGDTMTLTKRT